MESFRRYEKKYLLDEDQYRFMMRKLTDHAVPDKYMETEISSLYYDTPDDRLLRRSIEKPEYKEKLRVRAYGEVNDGDEVFVELKKKLDGIVYKRRTKARCGEVLKDISSCGFRDEQIGNEIRYALSYYGGLRPRIYVGCTRTSFKGKDDEIRITFDRDLRYRMNGLSLSRNESDRRLTDKTVMELKIKGAMPLWLSRILDEAGAYPRGFSKVGEAYLKEMKRRQGS